MDWQDFREAFALHEHKVLGRKLLPFSLIHQFWLNTVSSPILKGEPMTIPKLEQAVIICSSTRDQIPKRLVKRVGLTTHVRWWYRLARYDWDKELEKFEAYINDQFSPPEIKSTGSTKNITRGGAGANERLPAELSTVATILKHTGWSEDAVWNLPVARAHWYCAAFNTLESSDYKLLTQNDRNHLALIERMKEQGLIKVDQKP